jgi:hypothetical protein
MTGGTTVLTSGVYCTSGAVNIGGIFVLDGLNNPSSVFIFVVNGSYPVTFFDYAIMTLINGAQACNVFWSLGTGNLEIGSYDVLYGTFIVYSTATIGFRSNITGRVWGLNINPSTNRMILCSTTTTCTSIGGACSPQTFLPFTLYNTGVNGSGSVLPNGSDSHFKVNGSNATVISAANVASNSWVSNTDSSSWIGVYANGSGLTTVYVYTTKFDLSGYNASTAVISMNFSVDDVYLGVYLNGVNQFTATGGTQWTFFQTGLISSGFVSGINNLTFIVNNSLGGPTGMQIMFTPEACYIGVGPQSTSISPYGIFENGLPNLPCTFLNEDFMKQTPNLYSFVEDEIQNLEYIAEDVFDLRKKSANYSVPGIEFISAKKNLLVQRIMKKAIDYDYPRLNCLSYGIFCSLKYGKPIYIYYDGCHDNGYERSAYGNPEFDISKRKTKRL